MSDRANTTRPSPEERLSDVATILATGILRLRQRGTLSGEMAEKSGEEISPDSLDLSPDTRLSVHCG